MEQLDCIVSITSWKGRIHDKDTAYALFSLIRQKTKYKFKVVLTLSKEEFPNLEKDLPEDIRLMYEGNAIDIVWADGNYKALKKLYPVCKLYDCPIMTTDDDVLCKDNTIEAFMDAHRQDPKVVLSECGINVLGMPLTGYFRLFPKDSFLDVDPKYFKECFQTAEDDLYLATLMRLKGTRLKYLHTGLIREIPRKMLDWTALRHTYNRIDKMGCVNKLMQRLRQDKIIR